MFPLFFLSRPLLGKSYFFLPFFSFLHQHIYPKLVILFSSSSKRLELKSNDRGTSTLEARRQSNRLLMILNSFVILCYAGKSFLASFLPIFSTYFYFLLLRRVNASARKTRNFEFPLFSDFSLAFKV